MSSLVKFKDGDDDEYADLESITISPVENGWIVSVEGDETFKEVYGFADRDEMIARLAEVVGD